MQPIRLPFIISADAKGVNAEIRKLRSSINSLSGAAKGPNDLTRAFNRHSASVAANTKAIQANSLAHVQLASASQRFLKGLDQGNVKLKNTIGSYKNIGALFTKNTKAIDAFGSGLSEVADEQLRLRSLNFKAYAQDLDGRITGVASSTGKLGTATQQLQMRQLLAGRALQATGDQVIKLGKNMQWTGRQITVGFGVPFALMTAGLTAAAYTVDRELTRIAKVYNFSADSGVEAYDRLRQAAVNTATEVGAAYGFMAEETLGVMAEFAQQGRVGEELLRMTETTMRTAFLGDVDTENATRLIRMLESAADIANGINIRPAMGELVEGTRNAERGFEDLNAVLERFNALENNTVITVADLAEELPDLTGTLNALNLSVEFGAAALTGMKEAGLQVNESQTALRTGLARLISPTKKAQDVFREVTGRELTSFTEGASSAQGAVLALAQSLRDMENFDERSQVLSSIFGTRQQARLSVLFDQIGVANSGFEEALSITGGFAGVEGVSRLEAYRTALDETERQAESLSGQIDRAKAAFLSFAAQLGETVVPIALNIIKGLSAMVKWISELPAIIPQTIVVVTGVVAAFGLLQSTLGVLLNIGGSFAKLMGWNVVKSLERGGMVAKLFANSQEAIAYRSEQASMAIGQQVQATNALQAAMARSQGIQMTSAGTVATVQGDQLKNMALRAQKDLHKKIVDLKRLETSQQQTLVKGELKKLEAARRELQLAQAQAKITKREVEAKRIINKLDQQALTSRINSFSSHGITKKDSEEKQRLMAQRNILKAQDESLAARQTASVQKINDLKLKELGIEKQLTFEQQKQQLLESHMAKLQSLEPAKRARLLKLLQLEKFEMHDIRRLQNTVGDKLAQQIIKEREILGLMRQQNNEAQKAVGAQQRENGAVGAGAARRRVIRNPGAGLGGAALMGASMLSGEGAVGKIGGIAGYGMMGAMFGGGPGAAIGAVIGGLVEFRESIADVMRDFGLLSDEMKSLSERAKSFADIMRLPVGQDPFGNTMGGLGSYGRRITFENSDMYAGLVEEFGDPDENEFDMQGFETAVLQSARSLAVSGISGDEIRAELEAAMDAFGSDLELDTIIEYTVAMEDGSAERLAEQVRIVSQEAFDLAEGGMGRKLGEQFGFFRELYSAGDIEEATVALEHFFDTLNTQSGLFDTNREFLAEEGFNFTDDFIEQLWSVNSASDMASKISEFGDAGTGMGLSAQWRELGDAFTYLVHGMGFAEEQAVSFLMDLPVEADRATQSIEDFAAAIDVSLDNFQGGGWSGFLDQYSAEFLSTDQMEVYTAELERLQTAEAGVPRYAQQTSDALVQEALMFAVISDEASAAADGLEDLEDAQQDLANTAGTQIAGALQENVRGALDGVVDAARDQLYSDIEEIYDANREAIEDQFDAEEDILEDRHDAATDALADRLEEESRLRQNAQDEQLEQLEESLDAQLEAYDTQTESLLEQAQESSKAEVEAITSAAQAKIDALEAEKEKINELDEARKRAFDAEKARQDFNTSMRNQSVALAMALASGDVQEATSIRGQMDSDALDYSNSLTEAQLAARREREEAEREAQLESIEDERDVAITAAEERWTAEIERIENTREAERAAIEEVHETRVEALEEEHRLADRLLERQQDARREALQEQQSMEMEALNEREQAAEAAAQSRRDASIENADVEIAELQRVVEVEFSKLNPERALNFENQVLSPIISGFIGEADLGDTSEDSMIGAMNLAGEAGADSIRDNMIAEIAVARNTAANAPDWESFGSEIANAIAAGAFEEVGVDAFSALNDFINFEPTVARNPNRPGGPQEFHDGGVIGKDLRGARGLSADERPIVAQTGEYMMKRSAVSRLGVPFLDQLNRGQGDDDVRFHGGGLVGLAAMSAALPVLDTIRKMGEAGGRALNQRGQEAFATVFGQRPGGSAAMGGDAMEAFMAVIRQQESGGRYNVTNEIGAHGAYQFMPGTWAGAVIPALGRYANLYSSTPDQQDAVARYLMGKYYDDFKSWEAVAVSWYGGPGRGRQWMENPQNPIFDRPQGNYPSMREYVQSIVQKMGTGYGVPVSSSGFGPFGVSSGAMGLNALQAPDWDKTWRYDNWTVGLAPHVVEAGASVLASIPGAQYISSALRPNIGNARSQHIAGLALDIGPYNWWNSTRDDGLLAARTFAAHPWVRPDQVFFGPVGISPYGYEGHDDHLHVGFKSNVPSLMTGGKIMHDNTLANLHAGETVLTKELTRELEAGIKNINNSSTVNVHATPGMDVEQLANRVIAKLEAKARLQGARGSVT